MTDATRENPNPLPLAPREAKGALVGEASAAPVAAAAPKIRGYAPPIIDTIPPPSSTPAPELPRLWVSFWSDGKLLHCEAAVQRKGKLERVELNPLDPVLAQGYAYFVKNAIALLDGAPLPLPAPAAEEPHEPVKVEPSTLEPEAKTKPDVRLPTLRRSQVQQLEAGADDDGVPPTNRNPDRK